MLTTTLATTAAKQIAKNSNAQKSAPAKTTATPKRDHSEAVLFVLGAAAVAGVYLYEKSKQKTPTKGTTPSGSSTSALAPNPSTGSGSGSSAGLGSGGLGLSVGQNGYPPGTYSSGSGGSTFTNNPTPTSGSGSQSSGSSTLITITNPSGQTFSGTNYKQVVNEAGGYYHNYKWVAGTYVNGVFVAAPPQTSSGKGTSTSPKLITIKNPSGQTFTGTNYDQVVTEAGGYYHNHAWVPGHYVNGVFVHTPQASAGSSKSSTSSKSSGGTQPKIYTATNPKGQKFTGTNYEQVINEAGGYYHNHVWVPGHFVNGKFIATSTGDASTVLPKQTIGAQSASPTAASTSTPHVFKVTNPSGHTFTGTNYNQVVNEAGGDYQSGVWVPGTYVNGVFVRTPVQVQHKTSTAYTPSISKPVIVSTIPVSYPAQQVSVTNVNTGRTSTAPAVNTSTGQSVAVSGGGGLHINSNGTSSTQQVQAVKPQYVNITNPSTGQTQVVAVQNTTSGQSIAVPGTSGIHIVGVSSATPLYQGQSTLGNVGAGDQGIPSGYHKVAVPVNTAPGENNQPNYIYAANASTATKKKSTGIWVNHKHYASWAAYHAAVGS